MMEKIFDLENPFMRALTKLADLVWLNILTVICCIPIITAGAAFTSLHHTCLRMVRDEDGNITRGYFRFFKVQFKQATILWLGMLVVTAFVVGDYYIIALAGDGIPNVIRIALWIITGVLACGGVFLFPMQARFVNSIRDTLRNAFMGSLLQLPRTLLMLFITILPFVLFLFTDLAIPLVVLFGISVPVYLKAKVYDSFFQKIEDRINEQMMEQEKNKENEETEEQVSA